MTKAAVLAFWLGENTDPVNPRYPLPQGFDLGLRSYEGNCDLCFLKGRGTIKAIMRERPGSSAWWIRMERLGKGRFVTEYSYADLQREVDQQPHLFDEPADFEADGECGDICDPEAA